jgi:hypothetical protein
MKNEATIFLEDKTYEACVSRQVFHPLTVDNLTTKELPNDDHLFAAAGKELILLPTLHP